MLIVGFLLLIIGADLLVKGSSNIAKKFNIPEILIGLTTVALGTSMPELIITISSASQNATDLIIGNAIGSNLCNLLLIMGIIAILRPIIIDKETKFIHLPVALLSILFIIVGIIALRSGGDIVVNETTEIAMKYGISERVIGLTIVAIGTALPELVTSIIAVIKQEGNLAVGNLIGSCILNSFLILGTGAIITPLAFSREFILNLILLIFSIILIWLYCMIGKKNTITRYKAILLLTTYLIYIINLFKLSNILEIVSYLSCTKLLIIQIYVIIWLETFLKPKSDKNLEVSIPLSN